MAFTTLVEWIHVSDLDNADPAQARQLVRQAREELGEEDPRVEALAALENLLWEGTVPVEDMRQFANEWGDWTPEEGEGSAEPPPEKGEALPFLTAGLAFKTLVEWLHVHDMEDVDAQQARDLIRDARQDLDEEDPRDAELGVLEEKLWSGSVPVAGLEAFSRAWGVLEGDQAGFLATVEKMRARLVEAWVPYVETPVLDAEVTAETVVGHRLLQDGIEGWLHALDQMERAENGEMSFDDALATAEKANRLLVATQRLAHRVAEEARD